MAASALMTQSGSGKILIASPRDDVRRRILRELAPGRALASEASGGAAALIELETAEFNTLLIDPQLEDLDVEELVSLVRFRYPHLHVVVLDSGDALPELDLAGTGDANATARFDSSSLPQTSTTRPPACDGSRHASMPATPFEPAPARVPPLPGMIGHSNKMQQLYRLARLVAPRDTTVLIIGGTGTGKELVARGIHDLSRRSRGPFVVVNCAAIPESLLEAELFGFTRGAFTGAFQSRLGRIHAAHGGTLLLDEVGELPLSMQAKLLRFVQEGEVQRLGSADLFRVDARVVAATNADLLQRVREKQFREDLYYRLAVFPLELPALRNRPEDVLPLAQHFLTQLCRKAGVGDKSFSPESVQSLKRHFWPGNVRELQHWIERAFVLSESRHFIEPDDLQISGEPA